MGRIDQVQVANYGSISDTDWIDIEETYTSLLGPNGAGKSNFLRALARFSQRVPIDDEQLCKFTSAQSREPSSVLILGVRFTELSLSEAPLVHPPLGPEDLSLPISTNDIELESDNAEFKLTGNLESRKLCISVYANGTHKIHLRNGKKVELDAAYEQRIYELEKIGLEVLNELEELDFLDNVSNEIDSVYKELTDVDLDDIYDQEPVIGADEYRPERDLETASAEDIAADVMEIRQVLAELKGDIETPLERLPNIYQNIQIDSVGDPIRIDRITNSDAYLGLLDAADIEPDKIRQLSTEERREGLDRADRRLTELLNGYLNLESVRGQTQTSVADAADPKSNNYTVHSNFNSSQLEIEVTDESGERFRASQQSTGIRWLLGFLLTIIHGLGDNDEPGLIVLDDPGVHLHPEAKRLLLKALRTITDRKQVIYSTHSPFLIDNDEIDHTRIVKHQGPDGSTVMRHNEARDSERDMDSLAPIRESLGASLAHLPFGGNDTILVEGYTDRQYLPTFNSYLNTLEGWSGIDDDSIGFVDGSGSRVSYMAQFLDVEGLNYQILLDDDTAGDDGLVEQLQELRIHDEKIHTLSDGFADPPDYDIVIEDLLPPDLFCEKVAETHPSNLSPEVLKDAVDNRDGSILDRVRGKLHQLNNIGQISTHKIDKGAVAEEVCYEIRRLSRNNEEKYIESLEKFQELLNIISTHLRTSNCQD